MTLMFWHLLLVHGLSTPFTHSFMFQFAVYLYKYFVKFSYDNLMVLCRYTALLDIPIFLVSWVYSSSRWTVLILIRDNISLISSCFRERLWSIFNITCTIMGRACGNRKRKVQLPCQRCKKDCRSENLVCEMCNSSYHVLCEDIDNVQYKHWQSLSEGYICKVCRSEGDMESFDYFMGIQRLTQVRPLSHLLHLPNANIIYIYLNSQLITRCQYNTYII